MARSDNETIRKMGEFISLTKNDNCYEYRASSGNGFWKMDPVGYNKFFFELYCQIKGESLCISLDKLEEIVIEDYFDLLNNQKNTHYLLSEIQDIPVLSVHALLPIFNIGIVPDHIQIGQYKIVRFQKLKEYINQINVFIPKTLDNYFRSDEDFYDVPFVDITVDARDNKFALETAREKLHSLVCFLNYTIFSDIRGIDVICSSPNSDSKYRHYLASPDSFVISIDSNHSNPHLNIDEVYRHIVNEANGNTRLIEIIQNGKLDNEIEKRIFNALNWIGLAIAEKNNAVALTQATFAVECLLQSDVKGEPISKSIVASISESLAFLLGENFDKRKEWEKRFKAIYGLRSKVAHGKGNDVTIDNVLESIYIAKQAIIAILTNPELKNAKTIQMVNNFIEKKRYTCMEDKA